MGEFDFDVVTDLAEIDLVRRPRDLPPPPPAAPAPKPAVPAPPDQRDAA